MNRVKKWTGHWVRDPLWGAIDHLTYAGLRCLSPQRVSDTGAYIGRLARHRFREADRNAIVNMKALCPQHTDAQIEALVAQMWQNIGRTLTETAVLDRIDIPAVMSPANTLLPLDPTRPAVFMYPHMGNWELLAKYIVSLGFRLNVVYEWLPNRFQRRLLETSRRRSGYTLITPDYRGSRMIHRSLARGESIGIAIDEFKWNKVVSPRFDGSHPPAGTNLHYAVRLARKYHTPLIAGYCVRDGFSFRLAHSQAMDMNLPEYRDRTDTMLVEQLNSLCRDWIVSRPEQWYMLHRARLVF